MPYIAPTQYQDRRALMANTDAQEQQTETSQLRNMLLGQENQRANTLRQIYSQGRQPTVEQIGAVDPNAAMEYQNNQSLQAQRESENMMRKQSALKGIMTRFREVALQRGYDPSRPETQHILEDLRPAFTPYIESVTGQKASDDPVSWDNVVALSDMTPGEIAQQKTQSEISKIQQVMPYELEQERQKQQIGNEYDIAKQQALMPMQEARDKRVEDYKLNSFEEREAIKNKANTNKPLPPTMMKLVYEGQQKIGETEGVKADIKSLYSKIDSGELDFGLITNISNKLANKIGLSTDESIALDTYDATLKQLQNTILNVAKEPQTDQDAVRAYETLVKNPYDPKNVKSQLKRIEQSLDRTANIQADSIKMLYENAGKQTPDLSIFKKQPSALNNDIPDGAIIQVSPSTGKRRYSVDGGQTWQMVK